MSDSKSGSKSDLNESNMPLLDDEQKAEVVASGDAAATEKEAIELSEKDDTKVGSTNSLAFEEYSWKMNFALSR